MLEMVIENQIIERICFQEFPNEKRFYLKNSVIDILECTSFEAEGEVVIEKCIINNLQIHSCWFRQGLIFSRNHVVNYIDYQMGGHNHEPMIFDCNIFLDVFNFFDCRFESELSVTRNIFCKGTNLLGNLDTGYKNQFEKGVTVLENVGVLDLDT